MLLVSTQPHSGLVKAPSTKRALYLKDPILLPNGDAIVFSGKLISHSGTPEEYFKAFFNDDRTTLSDLREEMQNWDGSWAFIYVSFSGAIYCLTDPLGICQLYYNRFGEISTTINPLVRIDSDGKIDQLYMSEVAKWGYNTDDRTPWEGIRRVTPNHMHMFMGSELFMVEPKPYFNYSWDQPNYGSLASQLRALVMLSVDLHLKDLPDGPIAVLLSGGLDSSIISYCLLEICGKRGISDRLRFYSINNADDKPYVEEFAQQFGLGSRLTYLSYDLSKIDFEEALAINETPVDLGSMIPNQRMFSLIPEKVIFTGDGPDELFGGYRRIDQYDSQKSDVFQELGYYHLPRLAKAAEYYGKDLRCPYLGYDIIRMALSLPFEQRKHKSILKEAFKDVIPASIINRPKLPLKNDWIRKDPMEYRMKLIGEFMKIVEKLAI